MDDLIYLIDMDSTISDVRGLFTKKWNEKYPERKIKKADITTFYTKDSFPKEDEHSVMEIWRSKGFFFDQEPIKGSIEALKFLNNVADVCLVTSHLRSNPFCVDEKDSWVEKYLGKDWAKKRLVFAKDKTRVYGNFLIDDKPEITGEKKPFWTHIHYEQPWNRGFNIKRLNWQNYKRKLGYE
jgi:5'-nucleotidase